MTNMTRPCALLIFMLFLIAPGICTAADDHSTTLNVGDVQQLEVGGGDGAIRWQSSDPRIAVVYGNGYVAGLRVGTVKISAGGTKNSAQAFRVEVRADPPNLIDPATLKQFDDNRVFRVNGRKCVGSQLNGQRNDDAEERKYTDGNRVINPEPLRGDRPLEWELAPDTIVYDGAGVRMGTAFTKLKLSDGKRVVTSKFNFGMSKVIDGQLCIYAFGVAIKPTPDVARLIDPKQLEDGAVDTSAWLPLDRVINKDQLVERICLGKTRLPAIALETESFKITGGDPLAYKTEFGELSIIADVGYGAVPSHYLRRPSGTVNVLYSVPGFGLGGQGLDSFLISDGAIFRPAKGVGMFVQPTYFPTSHPRAGQKSEKSMTFVYGAVQVPKQTDVYGWIAQEALTRPSTR